MNSEAQQFFIWHTIQVVRGMKLPDAVLYLRGLLQTCEVEALPELRLILAKLSESDKQLELIQSGQLKFSLETLDGTKPGGNGL